MLSERERQAVAARKLLGDSRIVAFLRAVGAETGILAVNLAIRDLDEGASLDAMFRPAEGDTLFDAIGAIGYTLRAKRRPDGSFTIAFGYVAGPLAGDGAHWRVMFREDDVESVEEESRWRA